MARTYARSARDDRSQWMAQAVIVGGLVAIAVVFYQYLEVLHELTARGAALPTHAVVATAPVHAADVFDSNQPVKAIRAGGHRLQAAATEAMQVSAR